jgi:hypothetical protein
VGRGEDQEHVPSSPVSPPPGTAWSKEGDHRRCRFDATAAYHILRDGVPYKDLGPEYFTRRNKEHAAKRLKKRLEDLGFTVEVRPADAPVSI